MIPIYRAKKIDSEEWVDGYFISQKEWGTKCLKCNSLDVETWNEYDMEYARCNKCSFDSSFHDDSFEHGNIGEEFNYIIDNQNNKTKIDQNTLAIHFPNMIDKNGKKIFASLGEDGVGGVGGDCCVNTIVMSIIKDKTMLFNSSMKHPFVFTTNGIYSGGICHLNKINNFSEYQVIGIHKGES